VSAVETGLAIRRILVALDASPDSLAALEAAVALAAQIEAELQGLFIEDVELLRMAESPLAREILYPSAKAAPLSRAGMEQRLKTESERARHALSEAAERARVPWSFRSVRGEVSAELLAAAGATDLLCLGKLGWSLGSQARLGSTALCLAASTIPVLLHLAPRASGTLPTLVYYDGSAAAKRAVRAAVQLANGAGGLTILVAAATPELVRAATDDIAPLIERKNLTVTFRQVAPNDETSLLRVLREEKPGLLILGSREPFRKLQSLEALLRESRTPVLLLGDGEGDRKG
jgi:nucleotide-binding universal stress UspA family protein